MNCLMLYGMLRFTTANKLFSFFVESTVEGIVRHHIFGMV